MVLCFVRCVVYALPFGNSYNMGTEDGFCCGQWQRTKWIFITSSKWPPQVLRKLLTFYAQWGIKRTMY